MPFPSVQYLYTSRDSAKSTRLYDTAKSLDSSTAFYFFNCDKVISSANPQTCHGPSLPFLKVL